MIILCMALIAYDVLVLIDPTRCFFLNCGDANVTYIANSTYNATISGWPLYITWPDYFQTEMNAKRIFQSVQLLCAGLFILFCLLYILTFMIYRHIKLHQQSIYTIDHRTFAAHETATTSPKHINTITESHPHHHVITTYTIEGRPDTSTKYEHSPIKYDRSPVPPVISVIVPKKSKRKVVVRPRASSVSYDRICTRCMKEPRMILTTNYERQNFFSHLCVNCNNALYSDRRRPSNIHSSTNRLWKP
jgi:Na+-transporting methylmalonyl-CoA/oxaloacetate decarboxylase gamma subunit